MSYTNTSANSIKRYLLALLFCGLLLVISSSLHTAYQAKKAELDMHKMSLWQELKRTWNDPAKRNSMIGRTIAFFVFIPISFKLVSKQLTHPPIQKIRDTIHEAWENFVKKIFNKSFTTTSLL